MGTLANGLKSLFYGSGSNIGGTSHRVPLLDASGNPVGSNTVANIAKIMGDSAFTGSVFVATRESDGYPRFRQPNQAASYASTAVGAAVFEAGRLIIVAKNQQASTKWATSNVSGGNTAISGREAAMLDFSGRSNTSTIITTLGDNAPAAKYCHDYYPSNVAADDGNFGAGRWWLPSAGELWTMWSHLREINRVLEAIGGTALNEDEWYWSSTEHSATYAWYLNFYNGSFDYGYYKTLEFSVRPVSAFY